MTSRREQLVFRAQDGTCLSAEVRAPIDAACRGTAVLLHAMLVDARTFDRPVDNGLSAELQRAGWRVVLCDFRGRRASGETVDRGGRWTYDDLVHYDTPAFVAAARALDPRAPLVVVGHSLGGHVAAAALACGVIHVDALALLATNVWLPSAEPSASLRSLKRVLSATMWLGATLAGRLPGRALGVGPVDEAAPYARDIARFHLRDRWASRDGAEQYDRVVGAIIPPISQWHASGDKILAPRAGAAGWSWPFGAAQFLVGDGACGVEFAPSHMEIVTDARCRPAWQALARWLGDVTET